MALAVLVVVIVVVGVSGGRQALARDETPGEERYDQIKREVSRLFGTPSVEAQIAAARLLSQADCDNAAKGLVTLIEYYALEPGNRVRGGHAELCAAFHHNLAVREAAIASLATLRSPEALEVLLSRKVTRGSWELRSAVLRAFGHMRSEIAVLDTGETRPGLDEDGQAPVIEVMLAALADRHPIIREAATWAFADWADPSFSANVREHLGSENWQVRLAAVRALARFGIDFTLQCDDEILTVRDSLVVANLAAIIDALKRETPCSRMREEMHTALKAMTGMAYSDDPKVWGGWLDAFDERLATARARELDRLEAEANGEDLEEGATEPVPDPIEPTRERPPQEPYYYGVPVGSGRNVFVLDVTGSMMQVHNDDDVKAYHDEARLSNPDRPPYNGNSFLDLAKYELRCTLDELSEESHFTVLLFEAGRGVQHLRYKLERATADQKRQGQNFVNGATPGGETNLYDGLIAAYTLREYVGITGSFVDGPDTVYLFTDGRVNNGTLIATDEILAHMRRVYELRHVRIHTIGVGEADDVLLSGLAADSGAQYQRLKIRVDS